jgi:hypothetical protein
VTLALSPKVLENISDISAGYFSILSVELGYRTPIGLIICFISHAKVPETNSPVFPDKRIQWI